MISKQKLIQPVHTTICNICEEIGTQLDKEYNLDAMELISELIYKKLLLFGSDLEAFQRHAKRSTINVDDVKLLVRRNSSLKQLVDLKVQQLKTTDSTSTTTTNKRKRKATGSTS